MNKLLKEITRNGHISLKEAIELVMEEYIACDMNVEETLYNLGFEPDYYFDLLDILARK